MIYKVELVILMDINQFTTYELVCNGLDGEEVMLAHCGGNQARDQKAAGGLTTSTWCIFSPHGRWRYTFYYIPLKLCYLLEGRDGLSFGY